MCRYKTAYWFSIGEKSPMPQSPYQRDWLKNNFECAYTINMLGYALHVTMANLHHKIIYLRTRQNRFEQECKNTGKNTTQGKVGLPSRHFENDRVIHIKHVQPLSHFVRFNLHHN